VRGGATVGEAQGGSSVSSTAAIEGVGTDILSLRPGRVAAMTYNHLCFLRHSRLDGQVTLFS
jgi:hypothetical protein